MKTKPTISIIGFGRFGKVLYQLLKSDFAITLYQRRPITDDNLTKLTHIAQSVKEIYSSDVVFFATPISSFEKVIKSHKQYFRPGQLFIDVLSVKLHPQAVFTKHLKGTSTRALLTHPMFGPDSSKDGFINLPMIMDQFTASDSEFQFWKDFFIRKKLRIIEMSAQEHDQIAANSQGLTHLIGRLINQQGLEPTIIDTLGTKKLLEIKELTCNDTWELFQDLQLYNPFTSSMRSKFSSNINMLNQKLSTNNNKVY